MEITLSVCRRKSSTEMSNAENNGIPIDDRPSNQVSTGSVQESPYMHLSNSSAPPIYAELHNNRPGNAVVQWKDSAPAGDNVAGDESKNPSAPPARPSLDQDTTLIDNDLYD